MDIQHLVDRLEDLIDEGRHVPFSKFTLIDEERALEIIDQMRISCQTRSKGVAADQSARRLLAQANEEATACWNWRVRKAGSDPPRFDYPGAQARANNILSRRREAKPSAPTPTSMCWTC